MSVCRGCGCSIDWIRTTAGRNMPVDPEPVFVVEGGGNDRFVTDEGEAITGRVARPEEESPALTVALEKLSERGGVSAAEVRKMEELERMFELFPEKEYPNINSAFRKLHANLMFRSERAMVSISGGADSDVMLDMIQALNPAKNYPFAEIHFVWFDTGIEYTATKQHLKDLEEKYGITIERKRAKTPVPPGCKTWGQPFISKQISQYISRLQAHGFQWEDEPFEVLYDRYPNCKAALRWWCNAFGVGSMVNIERCRLLKEFMVENPPQFPISDGCCKGAKKDVAHDYMKELKATINMVGIRKAEGGARATAYNSCFSEPSKKGEAAKFRPLFYFADQDKEFYCQRRGVVHSDLYEKYGFKRTGCACCPFGSRFEQELQAAEQLDSGLAAAAKNIFGAAYEYTRAYREFKAKREAERKAQGQTSLF